MMWAAIETSKSPIDSCHLGALYPSKKTQSPRPKPTPEVILAFQDNHKSSLQNFTPSRATYSSSEQFYADSTTLTANMCINLRAFNVVRRANGNTLPQKSTHGKLAGWPLVVPLQLYSPWYNETEEVFSLNKDENKKRFPV